VTNSGVARHQQLEGRHLGPGSPRTFGPEVIALKVQTRQSNLYIGEAARTRVRGDRGEPFAVDRSLYQMEDYIQQVLAFDVWQGAAVRVEKIVAFFTSRDAAVSDTLAKAGTSVLRHGQVIDVLLSARRDLAAARRFFTRALRRPDPGRSHHRPSPRLSAGLRRADPLGSAYGRAVRGQPGQGRSRAAEGLAPADARLKRH
jgi:Glycosyl hydrolase family 65, N-terminal domain